MDVLRAFLLILSRIGPSVWEDEGTEFPQVIFSSIKDNVRYLEMLQSLADTRRDIWVLSWVESYMKSIGNSAICRDVLPIVIHFLCEELQHQRFQGIRPVAISTAAKVGLYLETVAAQS